MMQLMWFFMTHVSLDLRVAIRIWTRARCPHVYAQMLPLDELLWDSRLIQSSFLRAFYKNGCIWLLPCLNTPRFSPSWETPVFLISYCTYGGQELMPILKCQPLPRETATAAGWGFILFYFIFWTQFRLSVLIHEGILTGETRFS